MYAYKVCLPLCRRQMHTLLLASMHKPWRAWKGLDTQGRGLASGQRRTKSVMLPLYVFNLRIPLTRT